MAQKLRPWLLSVALALAVGGLAAALTQDSMNIYGSLRLPPLAPPSFLFPIVWTLLYTLMGVSAAAIWQQTDPRRGPALTVYGLQLAANFLWSLIFFNAMALGWAFIWLLGLWALILLMIARFTAILPWAGYLQIPYLLWVSFAGYLNLGIFLLNRA